MPDSYTANVNLTLPEVGSSFDSWGTKLNADLNLLDAVFLATGLGTSVGLHVGNDKVLNVEGGITLKDPVDTTKVAVLDRSRITTATTRTYSFPDQSGTLATVDMIAPVGTIFSGYFGNTPPVGYVLADGRTIGSLISGATNRANADTERLFLHLWNFGFAVVGGRGASAAADWAADRQLALPNHSGRTMAGRDNLSGSSAGILAGYTAAGVAGGASSHTLTIGEMAYHNHAGVDHLHSGTVGLNFAYAGGGGAWGQTVEGGAHTVGYNPLTGPADRSLASGYTGGGFAHNNVQPTIAVDVIIAL